MTTALRLFLATALRRGQCTPLQGRNRLVADRRQPRTGPRPGHRRGPQDQPTGHHARRPQGDRNLPTGSRVTAARPSPWTHNSRRSHQLRDAPGDRPRRAVPVACGQDGPAWLRRALPGRTPGRCVRRPPPDHRRRRSSGPWPPVTTSADASTSALSPPPLASSGWAREPSSGVKATPGSTVRSLRRFPFWL